MPASQNVPGTTEVARHFLRRGVLSPQLMLQNLLAERFRLQVHRDEREKAACSLVIAKDGLKMHPSESGRLGYGPFRDGLGRHLRGKIAVPILANNLSGILGRPVVDQTGIDGLYDLDLNYADEASNQGTTEELVSVRQFRLLRSPPSASTAAAC